MEQQFFRLVRAEGGKCRWCAVAGLGARDRSFVAVEPCLGFFANLHLQSAFFPSPKDASSASDNCAAGQGPI